MMLVTELFFLSLILRVNFLKAATDVKADTDVCTIKYTEQPPSELSCNPYLLYLDPPQVYLTYACNAESTIPIPGFSLTWFRIYPDQNVTEEIGCPGYHINTSTRQRCILDLIGDVSPAAYFCQAKHLVNGSYESLLRSNIAYVHEYSAYSGSVCAGTNSVEIEMCADNNSTAGPIEEEHKEESSIDIHWNQTERLQSTTNSTYTLPYTVQSSSTSHVTNTVTTTYTVQSSSTSHVTNTITTTYTVQSTSTYHVTNTITTTYTVQSISTSHVTNTITTTHTVNQTDIPVANCSSETSFLLISVVCTFGLLGCGILVILLLVLSVVIHHYRRRFRNFEENREEQEAVNSRNEMFQKDYYSTLADKYNYPTVVPSHDDSNDYDNLSTVSNDYDNLSAVSIHSYYETDKYNCPSELSMQSHHVTKKYDYPTKSSYRENDIQLSTEIYALPSNSYQQSQDATCETYQYLQASNMEYTTIYTQLNTTEYENTKQL